MPTFELNKLVRNKIVEKNVEIGAKVRFRTLRARELIRALIDKVLEEISELSNAKDKLSELADAQQALDDIRDELGFTEEEVKAAQKVKNDKNGSFSEGHYIESVDLPEDSEWVGYYRKDPKRFREIKD